MTNVLTEPTSYLRRPGGRVGYDASGHGPSSYLCQGWVTYGGLTGS